MHRGQVALQVMHTQKRALVQAQQGCDPVTEARHQSAHQTWSDRGRRDGIQLPVRATPVQRHPGPVSIRCGSASTWRREAISGHNTTPTGMLLNLRCNPRCARTSQSPIAMTAQDSCCGLVTTCFEGKHCMHRSDAPPLLSDL